MHDLKDELLLAPYLDLLFSFVLAWFLGNHCKPYCMTVKETRNEVVWDRSGDFRFVVLLKFALEKKTQVEL